MTPAHQVNLTDPSQRELATRIALSWIEIRRGASMAALRDSLCGTGADALEQGQMDTLDLLAQQPSWRMSELAEALRVDPSTATRAVQRLVNVGLACRGSADGDGRVVMVTITPAGSARHAEVAERRVQLMTWVMGSFDPTERAALADLLERFVGAVDGFVQHLPD